MDLCFSHSIVCIGTVDTTEEWLHCALEVERVSKVLQLFVQFQ